MTTTKDNRITVRLDDEAFVNLQELVENSQLNRSQIINELLKQYSKVWIIDGRKIAAGLQELRVLLKGGACTAQVRIEVTRICKELEKEIYRTFMEGEDNGNL